MPNGAKDGIRIGLDSENDRNKRKRICDRKYSITRIIRRTNKSISFFKNLIPFLLTLIGMEIGSSIVAYQPISTSWRELHSNGIATNISNATALHEFWNNGTKEYAFGDYANRISLNSYKKLKSFGINFQKKLCSYLVLGDSFSFGWLVEFEEAFPALIENNLNKIGPDNRSVEFINAAAGGWGLADYPAYLEIYKEKLKQLDLNGIIVFVNLDDGKRAAISSLYSVSRVQELPVVKKENGIFNSRSGFVKRTLNHPVISPFYNFSQKYSNFARILKRIFLDKRIQIDPRKKLVENPSRFLSFGETVETNRDLSKDAKLKIDHSILDLQENSSDLAPLLMVYTGVVPKEGMDPANRYMFSQEFKSNVESQGIKIDFSTLPNKKLYPDNHKIKYDGHPNEKGHRVIANHILNSQSENSLNNFIETTCSH